MNFRITLIFVFVAFVPLVSVAQEIEPDKSGSELREFLRENYSPTSSLSYSNAREIMFSEIDNDGGDVRLVYTGKQFQTTTTPNHQVVNTEHTWPQSKFRNGHRKWQMKSDLHHLFPTWSKVNSARGSFPFGEIPDSTTAKWWISADFLTAIPNANIDSYSESVSGVFEPREDHKGNVARSMFYFYSIYEERGINLTWFNPQIPTLVQWHFDDPVDQRERDRNEGIKDAQGNLNPFVLDASLAARIFINSDGGGPTPFVAGGNNGIPGLRIQVHQARESAGRPNRASFATRSNQQKDRHSNSRGSRDNDQQRDHRTDREVRDDQQTRIRRRDDRQLVREDRSDGSSPRRNEERTLFPFKHMEKSNGARRPRAMFAEAASGPDDGEIRIATFNIANFGATEEYNRSLISLANALLVANSDLICLQEVQPNGLGSNQVSRLTDLLNEAADFYDTKTYRYRISSRDGGDELTAFLWRRPVVLDSSIESLPHDRDHDNDGKRSFQRVPQMAAFHAGNFDFVVVNCHSYTQPIGNSSEGRIIENRMIAEWLEAVGDTDGEQDVVVLGDLNRHLGDRGDEAWDELMYDGHEDHFRFPLLEAIQNDDGNFDPLSDAEADLDEHSTTASFSKRIYDQIILGSGAYDRYVDEPELGEDVGIVDFDNNIEFEWFAHNYRLTSEYLSDHRPVWIDLNFEGDDDD